MTKSQADEIEQETLSKLRWRANTEGDNEAASVLLNHCLMVQRDATATEFARTQTENIIGQFAGKTQDIQGSYSDRLRDLGLSDAENS